MSKWSDGREKALPLMKAILRALEARSSSEGPSSKEACIFNAIYLGLQRVLDVANTAAEILHQNPTNSAK